MNASNEVVWAWIHGPGLDQPVERIAFINGEARNRQVVHADGLGSVAALSDESGETIQTYAYAAFGGIREQTGTDLNRVTFTAREALGDSLGFFYYRYRVYDPNTGRFTTEDPLGFVDGANRYVYVVNNPVILIDPLGLRWFGGADDGIQVGRAGTIISDEPGKQGEWIEKHVPAMETMGYLHDALVGTLTGAGVPDLMANVPTMVPCYGAALITETVKTPGYIFSAIKGLFNKDENSECKE